MLAAGKAYWIASAGRTGTAWSQQPNQSCMAGQRNGKARELYTKGSAWYCVRSRRQKEHLAAAHVRMIGDIDVFCPRIRSRVLTKRGWRVVTEALFPGYFFAYFALEEMLVRVRSAHGVMFVLRFGDRYPEMGDDVINDLRREVESGGKRGLMPALVPGERVRFRQGPLVGLEAMVTQILPGSDRAKLLLEFLGRKAAVEAKTADVLPTDYHRFGFLGFAARFGGIEKGHRCGRERRKADANVTSSFPSGKTGHAKPASDIDGLDSLGISLLVPDTKAQHG
jgi:transcriptional antiterminator RfaH